MRHWPTIIVFLLSLLITQMNVAMAEDDALEHIQTLLMSKNFNEKTQAVSLLALSAHVRSAEILRAYQDGKLYYRKADKRLLLTKKQDREYFISDALTGDELGVVKKREIKKITSNNTIRKKIRIVLAGKQLNSADADVRYQAVNEMLGNPDANVIAQLKSRLLLEQDKKVSDAIELVIAISNIDAPQNEIRLASIATVSGSLEPIVRSKLESIAADDNDEEVRAAAKTALDNISVKLQVYSFLETLFFGLSLGSVLVLAAIGLAITFGVMGVINMAHGELIMLGAYTTYVIQQAMPGFIGASIIIAIPVAFIVSGSVGILIERTVIRHLYGRPLETLLATFGISLILQQAVRSIFSPLNRSVVTPEWMSGSLEINSVLSLTYNRLYIIFFCLLVFLALFLILKKTSLGLQVRAVTQNRAMARAMGVRSAWVDAMTFGLGSGIAGVAGVALSQLTNVGPNLGQAYIVDSFMVVVFGGVGNLAGTLISGFSLGVANQFLEPWAGAVFAKILILVFIILFIQKRPRGLFPQKGRSAEG
ncbi:MAG: urea ABC transporter permease subunit UrtB [Gammaproteobacteria bacterium]|nr:urea ABC transporter permease subunit UrtB [Gammaproteobacteria bacterium]